MKGKGKYISNLDLKLLGAKFITVPDSHLQMSINLTDFRRSREGELPSILKNELESQEYGQMSRKASTVDLPGGISPIQFKAGKRSSLCSSKEKIYGEKEYPGEEKTEIIKYRSLIQKIKIDNDALHKEITNLYRQKKITDNEPKTRPIKHIFKMAKDIPQKNKESKAGVETKQYNEIYERLNSQDNPYRKEGMDIQKKLSSSNLHKNFEAFLQSHNRRIPDFIKQIR